VRPGAHSPARVGFHRPTNVEKKSWVIPAFWASKKGKKEGYGKKKPPAGVVGMQVQPTNNSGKRLRERERENKELSCEQTAPPASPSEEKRSYTQVLLHKKRGRSKGQKSGK